MREILLAPFVWLFGILIFLGEWLWDPLLKQIKQLAHLPIIKQIEKGIARFPPYQALALFSVPVIVLFPFKFFGLYLLAHGQEVAGVLVFAAAKIIGTGAAAWIYSLTEPALSKLIWFVTAREKFLNLKHAVYEQMQSSLGYRFVRRKLFDIRFWIKAKLKSS